MSIPAYAVILANGECVMVTESESLAKDAAEFWAEDEAQIRAGLWRASASTKAGSLEGNSEQGDRRGFV